MIEELTPTLLSSLVLLVVGVAPVLTLLLCGLLLWRYRVAVARQMAAIGGFAAQTHTSAAPCRGDDPGDEVRGETLYGQALRGPWRLALRYAGAGAVFALVFAVAARFVYPYRLGAPGFLLSVWIYAWPVVPALILIVPASWRARLAYLAAYLAVFLVLVLWAGTITDIAATKFGAITLPARSSANPVQTTKLWLVVNGVPSVLMLLCFNRWVGAVAPLVLGFVTTALGGTLAGFLALFSRRGTDVAVALSVSLNLHVMWLVLGTLLLTLAAFGAIGWALARWIAHAYRRKRVNDQSLILDALWLLFASYYAMWLILGGLEWMATAPVAFIGYKLALALSRRFTHSTARATSGLIFLRVFSLGRRSERLFNSVARYWRHIGSVQMITGPDVAHSTVQPHQFLDFLSGKLASHFVRDAGSMEQGMAALDRAAGSDGRFCINNFFCHADSWQSVLPRLVEAGDAVLMDLRSFSPGNAGCIHEIRHLAAHVALERCLLVVDDTTDMGFLDRTLVQAWQSLAPDSPNHGRAPEDAPLHRFGAGAAALRELLQRLCAAVGVVSPGPGAELP